MHTTQKQRRILTRSSSVLAWMASLSVSIGPAAQEAPNATPRSDSARVTEIVARARTAAGREWTEAVEFFCGRHFRAAEPARPPSRSSRSTRVCSTTSIMPSAGRRTVVWAVTTPDGILLYRRRRRRSISSSRCCLRACSALGLDPSDAEAAFGG